MGCWDVITIKATTTPLCTPDNTPDLHLPLKRIRTSISFDHFPWIVPLCPALLELCREQGSPNLNIFDEIECECVRVHMSPCCFLCVMSSVRFSSSWVVRVRHGRRQQSSRHLGPFKTKILLGWDLSDLAPFFFLPLQPLHLSFSLIIFFHSSLILSSLDLLDAAVALKVVLEKGKIIGNKVNTLVGA